MLVVFHFDTAPFHLYALEYAMRCAALGDLPSAASCLDIEPVLVYAGRFDADRPSARAQRSTSTRQLRASPSLSESGSSDARAMSMLTARHALVPVTHESNVVGLDGSLGTQPSRERTGGQLVNETHEVGFASVGTNAVTN